MRNVVAESFPSDERGNESIDSEFDEWFGDLNVVPAAYQIVSNGRDGIYGLEAHVYEVENSKEIDLHKLVAYGRIADGDGPLCILHIIDKYDHELVVDNDALMPFCFAGIYSSTTAEAADWLAGMLKEMRRKAVVQHHAPVIVADKEQKREIVGLRRKMAKMEYSQAASLLQNIIHGLGCREPHSSIASKTDTSAAVVRGISRLLTARQVNPVDVVNNQHKRWKVAYDAMRELGISV